MAGSSVHEAGALVASLASALVETAKNAAGLRQVPYCASCAAVARKPRFLNRLPGVLTKPYLKDGQTSFGPAFEILNAGKDMLRRNREFVKIRYTNARVLTRIRELNPDIEIRA